MLKNIPKQWIRRLVVGAFLAALFCMALIGQASGARAENDRIVTVYHDGVEQTVVTNAKTVAEALDRAHVSLNKDDSVEPGAATELIAPAYNINVYRARPVTVVDGVQRYTVMTPHTSAREIAQAAGVKMYDEDTYDLVRIDNFVADGGVGLKLTLHRAIEMQLVLYGQPATIRTQATTIGELMRQKKIILAAQDGASLPPQTLITKGMTFEVWRNGVQTITNEEEIPFTTKQIRDADHEIGYKVVQQAGVSGKKMVTYEIEMKNGHEVSRKIIQSVVTQDAKQQTEVIGVKPIRGPADPAANQALGHDMLLAAGYGEDQWPCLLSLWGHESHWNQYASNKSGAYGIPQALPGSKMGTNWDYDPVTQINWGLGYIKGRYGSPCGAWNYWQAHGWY